MRGGLYVLGAVRVERDAGVTALAGTQPRAVLVYAVLAEGRPVPAEELAALLWPDGPATHWEGALRGVVAKVRAVLQVLGPDGPSLDNVGHSYRFVTPPGVDVDVVRADAAVLEADAAIAQGALVEAVALADEAASLLRAGLLPGVDAEWLEPARAQLTASRVRALRLAADALGELGRHEDAVSRVEEAVAVDAFDEASHRALIRAHLASGRRAAALRAYAGVRRLLADELGIVPSDQTEALHVQALEAGVAEAPPTRSRPGRRDRHPRPTTPDRFVGRARLLADLRAAWDLARGGQRQIVLLHGEAGAGKTRLALEAARRLEPTRLGYGRCSPEQAVPFASVAEVLAGLVVANEAAPVNGVLARIGPELAHLLPGSSDMFRDGLARGFDTTPTASGDHDRARAFTGVTDLVAAVVEEPAIVVVDDLQWCDPSSLELVRHLLTQVDHGRLLVLITYRDEGTDGGAFSEVVADLCRLEGSQALLVGPLAADEVAELVVLRTGDADDELVAVLHDRSGGNAFYLQQLLAARDEDPDGFDPRQVPGTVRELVRHRVAGLPAAAQEAIAVAAVLGASVDEVVLDRVLRDLGTDDRAVGVLVERGVLVEAEERQLAFAHEIVRDAVYQRLTRGRRRRLHLAAVRAWAQEPPGLERATAIAHHRLAADDPAGAAETLAALLEAAAGSSRVRGDEQAVRILEQAEALVARFDLGDPAMAETCLRLGAARRRAGSTDEAVASLRQATDLARRLGRHHLFAEAVLELVGQGWRGAAFTLDDAERVQLLEEAVTVAPDDDAALAVGLLVALARTHLLNAHLPHGVAAADLAVAAATTSGRAGLIARAVEVQRLAGPGPDAAPTRLAATDALLAAPEELSPTQRAQLHAWRLADRFDLGDRPGVEQEWRGLVRCADEADRPHWRWVAASWRATLAALDGDHEDADRLARAAVDEADGADQLGRMLAYGIQLVGFRLHQGRGAEVVGLLRVAVGSSPEVAAMRAALAMALAQAGEDAEAGELVATLTAGGLAAVPRDVGWSTSLVLLAGACVALGDRVTASVLLPALEPYRDRFVLVGSPGAGGACWGPFVGLSAELRAVVGDATGAAADFTAAARAVDAFGSPALRAHVAAARNRCLGAATG